MRAVGIDLGTTNSVIAAMDRGTPRILPNAEGEYLTRSVVSMFQGNFLVGTPAVQHWPAAPADTIISVKRLMGRSVHDPVVTNIREHVLYRIEEPKDGAGDGVAVVLGGKQHSPAEISAIILKKLKHDAEQVLGEEVTHAVITVPAYFNEKQKYMTKLAGLKAGLKVLDVLDEPTCAAIAYGIESKDNTPRLILVFDLGGGSFNISILMMTTGTFAQMALEGDMWLGGDNFDQVIVQMVLEQIAENYGLDPRNDLRFMAKLKLAAQKAKESLVQSATAPIFLEYKDSNGNNVDLELGISRKEFEKKSLPLVAKTIKLVCSAINKLKPYGYGLADIKHVLLAGNATGLPRIQRALNILFGKERVVRKVQPKHSVALGAAIAAERLGLVCLSCGCWNDNREAEVCSECGKLLNEVTGVSADGTPTYIQTTAVGVKEPQGEIAPIDTGSGAGDEGREQGDKGGEQPSDDAFVGFAIYLLQNYGWCIPNSEFERLAHGIEFMRKAAKLDDPEAKRKGKETLEKVINELLTPSNQAQPTVLQVLMTFHGLVTVRIRPVFPEAADELLAALKAVEDAIKTRDPEAQAKFNEFRDKVGMYMSKLPPTQPQGTPREGPMVECPRCQQENPQGTHHCKRCHFDLLTPDGGDFEFLGRHRLNPEASIAEAPSATDQKTPKRHPSARSGTPEVPGGAVDHVHFLLTAPPAVLPETAFVLNVWAHLEQQRVEAIERARASAGGGEIYIQSKGPIRMTRGTILTVHLRLDELIVKDPDDTILWEGDIGNATFAVIVPKGVTDGAKPGIALIYVDGLQIAKINFVIQVCARISTDSHLEVREERHRKAFASYASADRDEVLVRIQGILKAAPDLDIFIDVLKLRSGQDWEQNLWREIPSSDVFYLFWSRNAKESRWVETEWRCALKAKGIDFIDPVPLVSPDEVSPPPELASKHFNDWTLAFMRGRRSGT